MKYYSTQRPVSIGTYPVGYGVEEIHNYDDKTYCEEIGREAWGYIITTDAIPDDVAEQWELTPADKRTWWCVVTTVDNRGRIKANITATQESAVKPENREESNARRDIYVEWFGSREEAEKWVEEARTA